MNAPAVVLLGFLALFIAYRVWAVKVRDPKRVRALVDWLKRLQQAEDSHYKLRGNYTDSLADLAAVDPELAAVEMLPRGTEVKLEVADGGEELFVSAGALEGRAGGEVIGHKVSFVLEGSEGRSHLSTLFADQSHYLSS